MIVAIGALGGSGTRIVAHILKEFGFYIGDDLNGPKDNLLYTRLFKNPKWYNSSSSEDRDKRHAIFEKLMNGKELSFSEKMEWLKASFTNNLWKSTPKYYLDIFFNNKKFKNIENSLWGWKEPNSHIYYEDIVRYFKDLKYIYVIRHGLDMAFSSNTQQLVNWGYLFDIHLNSTDTKEDIYKKQLDYWIMTTERILDLGLKNKKSFYVLNHQNLCNNPFEEINKLIGYLNLNVSDKLFDEIVKLPKVPSTNERYKQYDLSIFDKYQIEKVKSFGFKV